jgi:LytR cell envelope-related transcriptional attenuator
VAVLNGTAVPGLAAKVGDDVEAQGFKLGAVSNTTSSFTETTAMYARGKKREASAVAEGLGVTRIKVMTPDVKSAARGAPVAVVVGSDRGA